MRDRKGMSPEAFIPGWLDLPEAYPKQPVVEYGQKVQDCSYMRLNSKGGTYFVLIDDADIDKVMPHPWNRGSIYPAMVDPDGNGRTWAGATTWANQKTQALPRFLLDLDQGDKPGHHVDHISRRRWDNRRCNLRLADRHLSSFNQRGREQKTLPWGITPRHYKGHARTLQLSIKRNGERRKKQLSFGNATRTYDEALEQLLVLREQFIRELYADYSEAQIQDMLSR